MKKVVKLTEATLRKFVLSEAEKIKEAAKKGKGKSKDPVEKGGKIEDVKGKELKDGGDYAETLAQKIDYKKAAKLKKEDKNLFQALQLEESRLVKRLKEVRSLKTRLIEESK
jgi:hypothetical protein